MNHFTPAGLFQARKRKGTRSLVTPDALQSDPMMATRYAAGLALALSVAGFRAASILFSDS